MGLMMSVAASLSAQSSSPASSAGQSFDEFRQKILDDFQDFRHTILQHYADFLEGTWHEYEPLEPMKRDATPKPVKIPDVKLDKPSTRPVSMPKPVLAQIPVPDKPATPKLEDELGKDRLPGQEAPSTRPSLPGEATLPPSPFAPPKAEIPPEAKNVVPPSLKVNPDLSAPILGEVPKIPIPVPEPETPVPETPRPDEPVAQKPVEESKEGKDVVNFYGMEILVPAVDVEISPRLEKVSDFARHWKTMDSQDMAEKVMEAVMPKVEQMGLNDYLTFEFLCAYFDSKFPDAGISSRMSAVHYMLANMEYNARLAVATRTGDPIILIPAEQQLYGVTYMTLGGQNFYVLGNRFAKIAGSPLATCDLPKGASSGKKFDMTINGLNIPRKDRKFDVKYGDMHLTGSVNENLMPMVYRYPQMDTGDFAKSTLDKSLRDDLVRQVKEQLGDKDKLKATNALLQFVQSGFEYATDDDFHGFEKPYFLEENLYYPKNDCEDRSIFYTYLLWNALGVENQLLAFPGHESASVAIDDPSVTGTSYMDNGKRYYISDPTYIGSKTGMCMRRYESTAPTIDLSYPTK